MIYEPILCSNSFLVSQGTASQETKELVSHRTRRKPYLYILEIQCAVSNDVSMREKSL